MPTMRCSHDLPSLRAEKTIPHIVHVLRNRSEVTDTTVNSHNDLLNPAISTFAESPFPGTSRSGDYLRCRSYRGGRPIQAKVLR